MASGPIDSSRVIHACYTGSGGGLDEIHLVDAGTSCPAGMTAITWNQTGPAGPAGPVGPAGPMGDTGRREQREPPGQQQGRPATPA